MFSVLRCVSIASMNFLQVRPELWSVTPKNSVFLSDSYTFLSGPQESPSRYGDATETEKIDDIYFQTYKHMFL